MNLLTGSLTTLSNLLGMQGNKTQYELYKEQAREYVRAARDQADLIKKEGMIALRNMQYRNVQARGQEKLAIGAKGGQLSGTNLDVLVRQEKIRLMDETTLKANYTNQAMLELNKGYQSAASAYGAMASKAEADKAAVWAAVFKGAEAYVAGTVRDMKEVSSVENAFALEEYKHNKQLEYLKSFYKVPNEEGTLKLNNTEDSSDTGTTINIFP